MTEDDPRKRAMDHLTEALDAEESTEKHFHVREAFQLLRLEDD